MKMLSLAAAAVGVVTACLAGFFFSVTVIYSSQVATLHLSDMPQTRLERLVKTGDVDGLRADFDRVVKTSNASIAAASNLMVNLRTLSFFTLLSLLLSALVWWKGRAASLAEDKNPRDKS